MEFKEYQEFTKTTAQYPTDITTDKYTIAWLYPVLGLAGEAGEIAEKFKKIIRDNDGYINAKNEDLIEKELGDVLWYLSEICNRLGYSLEEVAKRNIEKLNSRKERGVIQGSGDNR